MGYTINIEKTSGVCFGVERAIDMAEEILKSGEELYCLGQILHNDVEIDRLEKLGLKTIDHEFLKTLKDSKVLIRAHGEPPSTFDYAKENKIELINATCPIVGKLQERIKKSYTKNPDAQVVIFGKEKHAEVIGLNGQISNSAIIIKTESDLDKIDMALPVILYSQTTMDKEAFETIADIIHKRMKETQGRDDVEFTKKNTICAQVSNRAPSIREFAREHDLILFLSGKNSSNGNYLFSLAKAENENSKFISDTTELDSEWLKGVSSIGISGATSTPLWQLEKLKAEIEKHN